MREVVEVVEVHGKPAPRKIKIFGGFVRRVEIQYECVCWQCGQPFRAKNQSALYCSNACRQKAYRERRRDRAHMLQLQRDGEGIFCQPLYPRGLE